MQKKVDGLISLVEDLKKILDEKEQSRLSESLSQACFCLRSHDLVGLDIVLRSLQETEHKNGGEPFSNLRDRVLQLTSDIKEEFNRDIVPLSPAEELFLDLGYRKFFSICSEVYSDEFWGKPAQYRFSRISQVFSIYGELLNHEPFKGILNWQSKYRPPMESEISGPLFKFVRNVLAHFPFYDTWDEVWVSKLLINWRHPNRSIDKFLEKYCGTKEIKYRFKETSKPDFTYATINFPESYDDNKIYLKDIISEEQGAKFALVMMIRVLNTQIESA